MISFLFWLFIKFTLFPFFGFFISMGLIALILYHGGTPIAKIGMKIEGIFIFLVHLIFIYCYGFFGAYYSKLVFHYSVDHEMHRKWILILFSILALLLCYRETIRELNKERNKIASNMDINQRIAARMTFKTFDKELFYNLVIIAGYRTVFVCLLSFIIFMIFPKLIETIYGQVPYVLAKLFY